MLNFFNKKNPNSLFLIYQFLILDNGCNNSKVSKWITIYSVNSVCWIQSIQGSFRRGQVSNIDSFRVIEEYLKFVKVGVSKKLSSNSVFESFNNAIVLMRPTTCKEILSMYVCSLKIQQYFVNMIGKRMKIRMLIQKKKNICSSKSAIL